MSLQIFSDRNTMVRLFGTHHLQTFEKREFSFDEDGIKYNNKEIQIDLTPSSDLKKALKELPSNSCIGIEYLSLEDWKKVEDDLKELCLINNLTMNHISSQTYWDEIVEICNSQGHKLVWLEDINLWFKYNKASIDFGKIKKEFKLDSYSERSFNEWVLLNERLFKAKTLQESIHLLDRDSAFLKRIASENCSVVIAGVGHTDSWILKENEIKREYGIEIETYSKEAIIVNDDESVFLKYIECAEPDESLAYEFNRIRKANNLLETGKLSNKKPDWVGIWNVFVPSKGYFELFIEEQKGNFISGTIEDCIGVAKFEGTLTEQSIQFKKTYETSIKDVEKLLIYQGKRVNQNEETYVGTYRTPDMDEFFAKISKSHFYIEKPKGNLPLQMSYSWYKLTQNKK